MIKTGIIGAGAPMAGELLRILIRHPEVDVRTLFAPSLVGRSVSGVHHGFIGENVPPFSDKINPSALNAIFIAENSKAATDILSRLDEWPELRIIDFSPMRYTNREAFGMDCGLSEINRKCLVRGSKLAAVPSSAASLVLICLNPLALHLLLPDNIDVFVEMPQYQTEGFEEEKLEKEISSALASIQASFGGKINVSLKTTESLRGIKVICNLRCSLSQDEAESIFNSIYDDHNFTFLSRNETDPMEVEGTQKCVVSIRKSDNETLTIQAVADGIMRGGAGDAVHVLNLLFTLQEKVGLDLKPSRFGSVKSGKNSQTSWFA